MKDPRRSLSDRLIRKILASRFLTISALIHLLIIILFGGHFIFERYMEPPDIPSGPQIATEQPDVARPVFDPVQPRVAPRRFDTPAIPPQFSMPNVLPPANLDNGIMLLPLPEIEPGIPSGPGMAPQQGPGHKLQLGDLPKALRPRVNPEETGIPHGEKLASELAVLRALRWLQAQQHSDGTWGGNRGAFTGLAVLCYLGRGETPRTSHEFGAVVNNGIEALYQEALRNDGRLSFGTNFDGTAAAYTHAICTYALCEAYEMTGDERLVPVIRKAVDYILKGQRPDGGWAYGYDLGADTAGSIKSDTSVSGWQIQALKSALLTGVPGLHDAVAPALAHAMKNMDRVFNAKDGSFGYRQSGDRNYSLTGVGVLSRLLWLGRPDKTVHMGIRNIETREVRYNGADCNLYAWYYDTQACFQAQGGAWDWWKARFQDQLTNTQSEDGSWPPTGGKEAGGYNAGVAGDAPLYRTELCTLMLEVFYRYTPVTEETAPGAGVEGL